MLGLADLFFNFNSLVTASEKNTHKGKGSEVKAHDCIRLTMGSFSACACSTRTEAVNGSANPRHSPISQSPIPLRIITGIIKLLNFRKDSISITFAAPYPQKTSLLLTARKKVLPGRTAQVDFLAGKVAFKACLPNEQLSRQFIL